MVVRSLVAVVCAIFVGAHATGNMAALTAMFDIGIEPQHWLYLLALPFACVAGLVLLKN